MGILARLAASRENTNLALAKLAWYPTEAYQKARIRYKTRNYYDCQEKETGILWIRSGEDSLLFFSQQREQKKLLRGENSKKQSVWELIMMIMSTTQKIWTFVHDLSPGVDLSRLKENGKLPWI